MPSPRAVFQGEIPTDGIVSLLSAIEERRTTGRLRFQGGGTRGEVALVLGQLSAEQPDRGDGRDPVELLLALRGGTYEVVQELPPLPVSSGDGGSRAGTLSVHVPADLMNYCERAGLTGLLALEQDHRVAELIYDRGELMGIRLDGEDDEDLNEIFGWDRGVFRVEVTPEVPPLGAVSASPSERPTTEWVQVSPTQVAVTRRSETTGQQFLRVVEKSLTSILAETEQRRPPHRVAPALPPMPPPRTPTLRPAPMVPVPPPRERRDATVRVIYLGHAAEAPALDAPRSAEPARKPAPPPPAPAPAPLLRLDLEDEPATDTVPDAHIFRELGPRADPTVVAPPPVMDAHHDAPSDRAPETTPAGLAAGFAWMIVLLALAFGSLTLLAKMPLLE